MSAATATPTQQHVRRPIIIAILAIIVAIYGLVVAIGGFLFFFGVSLFHDIIPSTSIFNNILVGIGIIIVGIIIMAVAAGLWRLRMWAWVIAFIVILGTLGYAIAYGGAPYYGFDTFTGVISLLLLIYMLVVLRNFREAGKQRQMAAQQAAQ
jgi:hypothetical protein